MAVALKLHKVLSLPGTLQANSIYFVESGSTFSIYVTDLAGTVAHTLSGVGGYTNEDAQDAVGNILVDSSTVDFTYNDGAPSITGAVKTDSIDNTLLSNMPASTIKGNNTGGATDPVDLTVAQVKTLLAYTSTDVGAQPLDATLTALAGVSTAADKLIYATGVDAFSVTDLSSFGRSIIDDSNAAAVRSTLGIGVSDVVQLGGLVLGGYLQLPIITVSTNTTLGDNDHTVLCDTAGGNVQITLPTAAGKSGRIYRVKKISNSNVVNIVTTSAQTIDNVGSRQISVGFETVVVQSDNLNWFVI